MSEKKSNQQIWQEAILEGTYDTGKSLDSIYENMDANKWMKFAEGRKTAFFKTLCAVSFIVFAYIIINVDTLFAEELTFKKLIVYCLVVNGIVAINRISTGFLGAKARKLMLLLSLIVYVGFAIVAGKYDGVIYQYNDVRVLNCIFSVEYIISFYIPYAIGVGIGKFLSMSGNLERS